MPVVLGIDQSLRHTGLVWFEDRAAVQWVQIDTDDLRGAARLSHIKNTLLDVLDVAHPALAVMEGYSYGSPGRVFELGELGGVIKTALYERGVQTYVASPVQVKKFATGVHTADKAAVIAAVNETLGLSWGSRDDNLADAAALALIGDAILSGTKLSTRHQAEVVAVLMGKRTLAKKSAARTRSKFINI